MYAGHAPLVAPDRSDWIFEQLMAYDHQAPHMSESTTSTMSSIASWAGGLVVLLGGLIFVSPILFTGFGTVILTNILTGVAIAIIGSILVVKRSSGLGLVLAGSAIVALLGAWIVATPFVLEVNTDNLLYSNVVLGALVVVFVALSAVGTLRGGSESETGSATA